MRYFIFLFTVSFLLKTRILKKTQVNKRVLKIKFMVNIPNDLNQFGHSKISDSAHLITECEEELQVHHPLLLCY